MDPYITTAEWKKSKIFRGKSYLFLHLTDLSGLLVALGLLQRGGVGRRRPPAFYLFGAHFTLNLILS